MRSLLARLVSTSLILSTLAWNSQAGVVYVRQSATGANNGTSWADAYRELRVALPASIPGDQVWIAAGTYKPAPPGGDIHARFSIVSVAVYGGFRGTETSVEQRDWNAYPVVLSGDLNGNDSGALGGADNSRRVVDVITAVLDGVVVSGGVSIPGSLPGHAASVRFGTVRHCTFRWNSYGAIDVWSGGLVSDSLFYRNIGSAWGVATMHEEESQIAEPTAPCAIANCTFYDNFTSDLGIISDVSYWFGQATVSGTLSNTIVSGNTGHAVPEWGLAGSRVHGCLFNPPLPAHFSIPHISGDPRFVAPASLDFRLQATSPCIDAGANPPILNTATTDMAGHPRRLEVLGVPDSGLGASPIVDIGAYESSQDCDGNAIADFVDIAQGQATDLNENTVLDSCEPIGAGLCFGDLSLGVACPCGNQSQAGANAGCLNSGSRAAGLSAFGQARVSDDSVVLSCAGMGAGAPALFFQGDAIDAIYGPGGVAFGDGIRCAFGTVIRLGIKPSVGGAAMFGTGIGGDPRISVRGALPLNGGTRYYQVWYRDAASFCMPSTFNTSNGLAVSSGARSYWFAR